MTAKANKAVNQQILYRFLQELDRAAEFDRVHDSITLMDVKAALEKALRFPAQREVEQK